MLHHGMTNFGQMNEIVCPWWNALKLRMVYNAFNDSYLIEIVLIYAANTRYVNDVIWIWYLLIKHFWIHQMSLWLSFGHKLISQTNIWVVYLTAILWINSLWFVKITHVICNIQSECFNPEWST